MFVHCFIKDFFFDLGSDCYVTTFVHYIPHQYVGYIEIVRAFLSTLVCDSFT